MRVQVPIQRIEPLEDNMLHVVAHWRPANEYATFPAMSLRRIENARPLGNRILCRKVLTEETLPGGKVILLPERRDLASCQQAEVVLAGQGQFDEEGDFAPVDSRLTPGTWILHRQYARTQTDDEGEYFLLNEADIVAILEAS